jgi:hypothetical protein
LGSVRTADYAPTREFLSTVVVGAQSSSGIPSSIPVIMVSGLRKA